MASTMTRPSVARYCSDIFAATRPNLRKLSDAAPARQFSSHAARRAFTRPAASKPVTQAQRPLSNKPAFSAPATTAAKPAAPATPAATSTTTTTTSTTPKPIDLKSGFADAPLNLDEGNNTSHDWTRSFHGLSTEAFSKEAAEILTAPISPDDIEIKPDGIIYLPEIKYRRILNKAFGPGGWGLAPRGESIVTPKSVTREYALVAHGRLVSIARGEQDYFNPEGIPTASEGCKSNAMMRCCKDLGVASELWDPRFIRKFRAEYTKQVFVEHQVSKKRTAIWTRKDDPISYPWKETR